MGGVPACIPHPFIVLDQCRHPIAVVNVEVQHGHPAAPEGLEGVEGGHRREADEAESFGPPWTVNMARKRARGWRCSEPK